MEQLWLGGLIAIAVALAWHLAMSPFTKQVSKDGLYHRAVIHHMRNRTKVDLFKQHGKPHLFHWLVSKSKTFEGFLHTTGSWIWDSILLLGAFAAFAWSGNQTVNLALPIALGILALLGPATTWGGFGPRAYHLTCRPFGDTLAGGVFLAMWFGWTTGNVIVWTSVATILSILSFAATKFARQALILISPGIAIATATWLFLAPVAVPILLGTTGAWPWLKMSMTKQWRHLNWYIGAVKENKISVARRNSLRGLGRSWRRGERWRAVRIVTENAWIVGIIVLAPFILMLWKTGTALIADRFLLGWIIAALAAWAATSFRAGFFLGESERYLTIAVPAFVLLAFIANPVMATSELAAPVVLALVISLLHAALKIRIKRQEDDEFVTEVLQFLKKLKPTWLGTRGGYRLSLLGLLETDHNPIQFHPDMFTKIGWNSLFDPYPHMNPVRASELGCKVFIITGDSAQTLPSAFDRQTIIGPYQIHYSSTLMSN